MSAKTGLEAKCNAEDKLLRAVGKYIEAKGGKAIVAGPIQIYRWPEDNDNQFSLAIKVLGKAPPSRGAQKITKAKS